MKRIPPSQQIRQALEALWKSGSELTFCSIRLGAQRLAQEFLEQEATD
jgi:hypothetical protein